MHNPYNHAPRLSTELEGPVEIASLVSGATYELEIGPGRGGFLFERAEAAPTAGLIGMEIRRKWATIVDERLKAQGLGARARVFAEDAKWSMRRLSPDASIARIFMHFPDPWWKKRHTKRLVLGDEFLRQCERLLIPGGELFIQTDVRERAEEYASYVELNSKLIPAGDKPGEPWLAENPYNARSPREHRCIEDGLPIHRIRYIRQ